MSEIIKKHLAAQKFLTKAKYLTKDFKVPLFTGSEADIVKEIKPENSLSTLVKKQDVLDKEVKEFKIKNHLDKEEPNKNLKQLLNKTYGAVKMNPRKDYNYKALDGVSTWRVIRDSATSYEDQIGIKQTLNKAYTDPISRKLMDYEDLKFIGKTPEQLLEKEKKRKEEVAETVKFYSDLEAMREFRKQTEETDRSFEKLIEKKKEPAQGLAYLLGMD